MQKHTPNSTARGQPSVEFVNDIVKGKKSSIAPILTATTT